MTKVIKPMIKTANTMSTEKEKQKRHQQLTHQCSLPHQVLVGALN